VVVCTPCICFLFVLFFFIVFGVFLCYKMKIMIKFIFFLNIAVVDISKLSNEINIQLSINKYMYQARSGWSCICVRVMYFVLI